MARGITSRRSCVLPIVFLVFAAAAEEIARQASAFGQEDDITVLTVEFAPAGVAA